jgi:hypothetical protein
MLFALFVSTIVTGLALTLFLPALWCTVIAVSTFVITAIIDVRDQSAVRMLIFACLNVFFRDIETRNSHTIPKKGPLILVCTLRAWDIGSCCVCAFDSSLGLFHELASSRHH